MELSPKDYRTETLSNLVACEPSPLEATIGTNMQSLPCQDLTGRLSDREFKDRVFRLLGEPRRAKQQYRGHDGSWRYTSLKALSKVAFNNHLKGKSTVALSPIITARTVPSAIFLCWDIDELFPQRLDRMREVLEGLGFADASWAVTGSDDGRGKVILSLANPIPQSDGIALVREILAEAKYGLLWGDEHNATSTFPQGGQGGTVRILGRNRQRTEEAHLDSVLDLRGASTDLSYVVPYALPGAVTPLSDSPLSYAHKDSGENRDKSNGVLARAEYLRLNPYAGGGASIFKDMGYLAKAAILTSGKGEGGRQLFRNWLGDLEDQIPNDKDGTLRQLKDEATQARAWEENCEFMRVIRSRSDRPDLLGEWKPLEPSFRGLEGRTPTKAAWRVYNAAAEWVLAYKFDPHCLSIGYRQWAQLSDYDDPADCRKIVDKAESRGMLFRLDRGQAKVGGLCTLVTLVGKGETLQEAYDLGVQSGAFKKRLVDRADRGLPLFLGKVVNGRLSFPKTKPDVLAQAA